MIHAILITFAEVILHTVVSYIREKEHAGKMLSKKKVASPSANINALASFHKDPLSRQINLMCGKVLFPLVLTVSVVIYGVFAFLKYREEFENGQDGNIESCP